MTAFWKGCYRFLLQPLFWQLLRWQSRRKPNLQEAIRQRHGLWRRLDDALQRRNWQQPLLWLHASSAGELLQAEPLLRLYAEQPVQVALSFTSVNAKRWLESGAMRLPKNVIWNDFLPRDTHPNARRLLAKLQPSALVFVSYDLWPQLVWTAQEQQIPQFLVSALVHEGSWRHDHPIGRSFFASLYGAMGRIAAISAMDAQRIHQSQPTVSIEVMGDTRVDSVLMRRNSVQPPELPEEWQRATVFIGGSVWAADLECLGPTLHKALRQFPGLRLILVPHEPTPSHVGEIEALFAGHSTLRWSARTDEALAQSRVLIVDALGILAGLYARAHIAFVGGAFTTGVHNVMEPAAWGLPTLFGPRFQNYVSALRFLEQGLAFSVSDSDELWEKLRPLLENPEEAQALGQRARALLEGESGAAARFAEWLQPHLVEEQKT